MILLNVLYRFVGSFSNSSANFIILVTLILIAIVIYLRFKKLLITMIFAFFIASLFFAKIYPKKVYTKANFSVFSNGSYMYLNENHKGNLEYTMYSKKGNITEEGIYSSGNYLPFPNYQKTNYNFFADVVIITILLLIIYAILFLKDDFIRYRDFKRNINLIPFSYKPKEEQIKILKDDLYCKACDSKNMMSLEKEIYSKGMHMVYLKCDTCENIVKEPIAL